MRLPACAILIVVTSMPASAQAATASDQAVLEAVTAAVQSRRYQVTLPEEAPRPPPVTASKPMVEPAPTPPKPWEGILPTGYPPLVRLVFWLLVFGVFTYVALPALFRLKFRPRRRGDKRLDPAQALSRTLEPSTTLPLSPSNALARARALAAQGKASEAVHVLLLAAIQLMAPALRERKEARAMTNREIAKYVQAIPWAGAFQDMVSIAEVIRFGGKSTGAGEIERCCLSFEKLLQASPETPHAKRSTG